MDEVVEFCVSEEQEGLRLDVYLAELVEDASRSYIKKLVKDKRVLINGEPCTKPAYAMVCDDAVMVHVPPPPPITPEPEDIPLEILFEDEEMLMVNKPSGLVVHPAPGHYTGTLVNAVLHHCPELERSGLDPVRPGIVHRLDRFTSGVMVVAKTQRAFASLAKQASDHSFDRRYLCLVRGEFPENMGRISAGIGRSLADRSRMAVTGVRAKEARTNFEVLERFGIASLMRLRLETGRTHQIRVHMRFAGRPVLGDPVYGVTEYKGWMVAQELRDALHALQGQALHAERLGVCHPVSGEMIVRTTPVPPDFQTVLDGLRAYAAAR